MWYLEYEDNGTQRLDLHPQFYWADELDYSPIAQSTPSYSLTGALIIEQGTKRAGRPITLVGDDVWLSLDTVQALGRLADKAAFVMRLHTPDDRVFSVLFARPFISNLRAIKPMRLDHRTQGDRYGVDLHFITV